MCPYFQGGHQWTLLLCDMQSAYMSLCSLQSERGVPICGLISGNNEIPL